MPSETNLWRSLGSSPSSGGKNTKAQQSLIKYFNLKGEEHKGAEHREDDMNLSAKVRKTGKWLLGAEKPLDIAASLFDV